MAENILAARSLTKRYGHTAAVENLDLTIQKGQIYGLVGRNGAGKTTIIRMISGQSIPTSGEIALFGETTAQGLNKVRARTGAMVEIPSFYPYLTARENLEYYRRQRGIPGESCVEESLEFVGLSGVGKKKFKQFS
ncbi:MAG: ABC transporter ATP-binding protein, partial [Clostridia bacterium]|nr:ABC transporter ATP-binding protein [Clostridia bacterium]